LPRRLSDALKAPRNDILLYRLEQHTFKLIVHNQRYATERAHAGGDFLGRTAMGSVAAGSTMSAKATELVDYILFGFFHFRHTGEN